MTPGAVQVTVTGLGLAGSLVPAKGTICANDCPLDGEVMARGPPPPPDIPMTNVTADELTTEPIDGNSWARQV
jgi:hypothetical protein